MTRSRSTGPAGKTTRPATPNSAGNAAPEQAKTRLQAAIERQSQLQLMIRTSGTSQMRAHNMRRLKIVMLFVWFGFWSFLESFLDVGHRVTHAFGIVSHRNANHNVLVIEGALWEGVFSAAVAISVGMLILWALKRIDRV